jgi:hypothetical protein
MQPLVCQGRRHIQLVIDVIVPFLLILLLIAITIKYSTISAHAVNIISVAIRISATKIAITPT